LSSRYHFCLFSALQGVPFVAIKRSDKVADLCEDLGWRFCVSPGAMEVDDLYNHVFALLETRTDTASRLSEHVGRMRERAWRNQAALEAVYATGQKVSHLSSFWAGLGAKLRRSF
jgi:polysaccharide pyruvyl transferase WcaK-like protein